MELFIITSLLLGLWMNWSFWVHSKYKWTNLHALKALTGFQVVANTYCLAVHLLLLTKWPFLGYLINPGNYLWMVGPVTCRLFTAVQEISALVCIANAAGIFVTNQGKDELKKERKRKIAFFLVSLISIGGAVLAFFYTKVIPLLKYGTLSGANCPSHSFSLLCGRIKVKSAFIIYVACSVTLFYNNSPFTGSQAKYILNIFFKCLSILFHFTTICALMFAVMFIPFYLLGGSLYSVTINTLKLYFDVTALAVSIGFPAWFCSVADTQSSASHTVQSSLLDRSPDNEPRKIKIRINTHAQKS
ncbi:uncharacterized protein LOC144645186 [Oculina patagonica]